MYKDPVCGMDVDPEGTEWQSKYHGEIYYFCSLSCLEDFEEDPLHYLDHLAAQNQLE